MPPNGLSVPWSEPEVAYLRELSAQGLTALPVARAINDAFHGGRAVRSTHAIRQKRAGLGVGVHPAPAPAQEPAAPLPPAPEPVPPPDPIEVEQRRRQRLRELREEREAVQPDRGERQLTRLLEILAVIEARGRLPMAEALAIDGPALARHTTLVVITPSTDNRWVTVLRGLRSRGVHGIAVFLAGRTFGPAPEWAPVLADLQASGLPGYVVKNGDDIPTALANIASGAGRGMTLRR